MTNDGSNDFKHNHYVPEWYQRRFMRPDQGKYWYLDLRPEIVIKNGHRYPRKDLLNWGAGSCFAEHDLYTTKWGSEENVEIEKLFFGKIDAEGKSAVERYSDFKFDTRGLDEGFQRLVPYMSVQKLRTPKGLGLLSSLPAGK